MERITSCPRKMLDHKTWRLIELADFAENGSFPVAGGVLDQCDSFLSACRTAWSESKYWKAKNKVTE